MPRPKKTAAELKLSGARAGRIRARELDEGKGRGEKILAPDPMTEQRARWLPYLKEAIVKERATFASRIVGGKTVCLELGGVVFNWRESHPLTLAREYAKSILAIPETRAPLPILRQECTQFLGELDHVDGYVMDPTAANLLELFFNCFDKRDWECKELQLFDFVTYVGWKHLDGTRRYSAEDRESYKHRNVLEEALKLSDQIQGEITSCLSIK